MPLDLAASAGQGDELVREPLGARRVVQMPRERLDPPDLVPQEAERSDRGVHVRRRHVAGRRRIDQAHLVHVQSLDRRHYGPPFHCVRSCTLPRQW